jgi:hypothetical protein
MVAGFRGLFFTVTERGIADSSEENSLSVAM